MQILIEGGRLTTRTWSYTFSVKPTYDAFVRQQWMAAVV